MSIIFVVSHLVVLIPVVLFGLYIDKLKVWKLVLIMHIMLLILLIIFVSKVPTEDHIYTSDNPEPFWMLFSFLMLNITASSMFTVDKTLLSKAIENCTLSRGVFMGAQTFCTSIGVLII